MEKIIKTVKRFGQNLKAEYEFESDKLDFSVTYKDVDVDQLKEDFEKNNYKYVDHEANGDAKQDLEKEWEKGNQSIDDSIMDSRKLSMVKNLGEKIDIKYSYYEDGKVKTFIDGQSFDTSKFFNSSNAKAVLAWRRYLILPRGKFKPADILWAQEKSLKSSFAKTED